MANRKAGFRFIHGQGMRCAVRLAKNGGRKMKSMTERSLGSFSHDLVDSGSSSPNSHESPNSHTSHNRLSASVTGSCFPAVIFSPPSFAIRISTDD